MAEKDLGGYIRDGGFFSALRNPTSKEDNTAAERGGNETRAAAATAVELRYIVIGGDDF